MSATPIEIRRLKQTDASDVVLYREIRLEALRDSSQAFGSTFEDESAHPVSWFSDRLGTSTVLGAFQRSSLVGIAAFAVQQGRKRAHKGMLWGMYVRPDARKSGIGRQLVQAVCDLARQHVDLIQLTVVRENQRAHGLYASLGFVDYGIERNALRQDGRYYDEVLMAKDLRAT